MKNKQALLEELFKYFHIVVILLFSISSTYTSYIHFYDLKPNKTLSKINEFIDKITETLPIGTYSLLSGVNCGYGFYAPNVKAEASIFLEANGEILHPEFHSGEGSLMFSTLIGGMTNKILEEIEDVQENEKQGYSIISKLDELILKNIGLQTLAKNNVRVEDFNIHYCLLVPNDLAFHNPGDKGIEIVKSKTLQISKAEN